MNSHVDDLESKLAQYENYHGVTPSERLETQNSSTIHQNTSIPADRLPAAKTSPEWNSMQIAQRRDNSDTNSVTEVLNSNSRLRKQKRRPVDTSQRSPNRRGQHSFSEPSWPGLIASPPNYAGSNCTSQNGQRGIDRQSQRSKDQNLLDKTQNLSNDDPKLFMGSNNDDNESDMDLDSDNDQPIMDGMVQCEVLGSEDATAEKSVNISPAFDFAMKIKASTNSKKTKSLIGANDLVTNYKTPEMHETPQSGTNSNAWSSNSKLKTAAQQDNFDALKYYMAQSYLHYVPQRMVANALLDRYFSTVHAVWPFLIENVTRKRLDQTYMANDSPNPLWMAQLNLVFALACQFYESDDDAPMPDIYEAGKQCYLRGHGHVIAHALGPNPSVTMLQNLLLIVQYQQGTMKSNECWLTTGLATRMALGLGIHTTPSSTDEIGSLDIEIRNRLWWGCYAFDR